MRQISFHSLEVVIIQSLGENHNLTDDSAEEIIAGPRVTITERDIGVGGWEGEGVGGAR
jgi:hypothetical protein